MNASWVRVPVGTGLAASNVDGMVQEYEDPGYRYNIFSTVEMTGQPTPDSIEALMTMSCNCLCPQGLKCSSREPW